MNRREFIRKTSIAGTVLASAPGGFGMSYNQREKPNHVIILGAGFAGLAAGLKLSRAGVKVTILEARKRAGGRVFSHLPKNAGSQVIELGAEWIGESHTRVLELCEEFQLTVEDNRFETDLILAGKYSKTGSWQFGDEMEKFWANIATEWEKLSKNQKEKLDKTDWWRFLSEKGIPAKDLFLRDLIDSTDFGESIRHTSAYAAFAEYAESSEKNEMDFKIKGGNSKLTDAMVAALGADKILLDHTAVSVDQRGKNKVSVTCQNGKIYEADQMICTLPTKALMLVQWNPGLPAATRDALMALQYSRIGKFPMVFSDRFWKREDFDMVTDTPAHYFYHGTKNQLGKSGVLMCYAVGEKADVLGSVGEKQREQIILEALRPAFGNVKKYLKENLMYYWGNDAYSSGAYAFYGKNQWFPVMSELKKPFQQVCFAGEHLADWQGFMEGAINTGEDAAAYILDQK